jgi:Na+/H+ antiporter NhaD/arsenite permease-like protein
VSIQIVSIAVLAVVFAIATVLPVNMGALAFAAAFLVGSVVMHLSPTEIFAGFPGDLFLTLVGVTYLFAIARDNGAIDALVGGAVKMVRGAVWALPWVMFVTAALLSGVGALGPAAVAILAPVTLRMAGEYRVNPTMMGLMVVHGAQAGGFSPISVYGGIVNNITAKAGLPTDPLFLFLSSLVVNFVVAFAVFLFFRGAGLKRARPIDDGHLEPGASATLSGHGGAAADPTKAHALPDGQRLHRAATLIGLTALAVGALLFGFNVGLAAITVGVVLALMDPKGQKGAVERISWSTVLLVCGVVTYVGVMQKAGAVDYVGQAISHLDAPLMAALLLCFTAAVVSAFASSAALLGVVIPLATPFMARGQVDAVGLIAAIAISTTIVDTSPFSTNGALVVANAPEETREKVLRALLIYSALIAIVGPIIAWGALVVPR